MPSLLHDALTDAVHLEFERTVPRSLVHKRSLDNVLLTEIRACEGDTFLCAGRLPTAHRFFNDAGRTPQADILFYTEIGRQASLAVSHAFLDVACDDVFIFEGSDAALTDAAFSAGRRSPSGLVLIDIRMREIARRKNQAVSRVVADHTMWVGGERVFHGTGAWTIQPAALFQRLRRSAAGRGALSPVPAPVAGAATRARIPHAGGSNIVISSPERMTGTGHFVSSLIVDDTHPYFFDHPCDHVPGMLLLEGCAQLAVAAFAEHTGGAAASGVGAYDVTFAQFVERGIPTVLSAQVDAGEETGGATRPPAVRIAVTQHDTVCGLATMGLMAPAAA